MTALDEITRKYDTLFNDEEIFKRKYYHLKSIRNFIIHFNEFGTQQNKSKVAELLNDYLDFAMSQPSIEQSEAKKIFYEYIQPIGLIYSRRLKFITYTSPSTIVLFTVILFIIFFLVNIPSAFYIATLLLGIVIFILQYLKYKQNKVFGYNF